MTNETNGFEDNDGICRHCGLAMSIPDDCEPTEICHECAQSFYVKNKDRIKELEAATAAAQEREKGLAERIQNLERVIDHGRDSDNALVKQLIEAGLISPCPDPDRGPLCWLHATGEIYNNLKEQADKIEVLREALEFYADHELYYLKTVGLSTYRKIESDQGTKARETLQSLKDRK